ncbi:MAG: hypothetical protein HFE62_01210 [Firmicutes bacterium]|nr:hypothetical protein [Bacillota bacterium]
MSLLIFLKNEGLVVWLHIKRKVACPETGMSYIAFEKKPEVNTKMLFAEF